MTIKINDVQYDVSFELTGATLLGGMLPLIAGNQFRGYQLQKINDDGIDTAVNREDAVNDGDSFWAIPPCHV